jgi:hypothetical protein
MAKSSDDKKFNETLKELLKTPPKHHEDEKKGDKPPPKKKLDRSAHLAKPIKIERR